VLRPFDSNEARAQSLLVLCKLRPDPSGAANTPELYVDHFVIDWMTRYRTAGAPLLLLVTSKRVVLGDEARLRGVGGAV